MSIYFHLCVTAKGQLEPPVTASAFSFAPCKFYGGLTSWPIVTYWGIWYKNEGSGRGVQ